MDGNWLDEAWKDMLIQEIDDAIEFFMPALAADRDYTKRVELMSEDMPGLAADTDKGGKVADLCLSVYLSGSGIQRVTLVLEQQHESDSEFARRIYTEFYRASDRLAYPVTSLAIFTGRKWHAGPYEYECYGTRLYFDYNIFRVAEVDIEALRRDERPFAVVVLAAALMLEAGDDPNYREKYARELLGLMMERNYEKRKKKAILNFVRRVFRLQDDDISQSVKEEWRMKAIPIEEAAQEVWIRHATEEGIERGREEGREEGMETQKVEVARSMRADGLPIETIKKYTGLPESKILRL
ncbi:MAG: hypothetical protein LBQ42_06115 [Synergistaceae bacterium]|nr:hypothetical protein [Synergistaceae bacterium]